MSAIVVSEHRPTYVISAPMSSRRGLLLASAPLTLAANVTIPVTHDVMRVAGLGGPVTLTCAPNLQTEGIADNRVVMLQGVDDAAPLTVQDAGQLPGSALRLQHGRNFALGKNDMLELIFIAADGLWIQITRADNY